MTYPYYPQTPPYPQTPRRSNRTPWIIGGIVVAVAVLVCGLTSLGVLVLMASDDEGGTGAPPRAASNVRYADPADRCTLVDASMVSSWGGSPTDTTAEDTEFPAEMGGNVAGCAYDLKLDTTNTLKLFTGTDGDAKARYGRTLEAYKFIPGGSAKSVAGLGTTASAFTQQGSEKRRIQSGIVLYENNLYLELRFIAGGTKDWDPAEVERHLVDTARAIMAKLPKA